MSVGLIYRVIDSWLSKSFTANPYYSTGVKNRYDIKAIFFVFL